MKLRCNECSKIVSTEVPLVVRAWICCPECVEKDDGLRNTIISLLEEIEKG